MLQMVCKFITCPVGQLDFWSYMSQIQIYMSGTGGQALMSSPGYDLTSFDDVMTGA